MFMKLFAGLQFCFYKSVVFLVKQSFYLSVPI